MRVRFLVDGFNLYHSVKKAEAQLGAGPLRWLDIWKLCQTIVQSSFGPGHTLAGVHYFSALATHLEPQKPDVVRRHRTFISALESTGVEVTLSSFKRKDRLKNLDEMRVQVLPFRKWITIPTRRVRLQYRTHEEKETDVAIACKLLELLGTGTCDSAMLLTGDTDIAPAIRTAQLLYPAQEVGVVFPFSRHNRDLERLVKRHVRLSPQLYASNQFPPTVPGRKGRIITKPPNW
jgi:hypothetical protein